MTKPVLVTSAAGGRQGKTGRHVSEMLLKRGVPVRAFVRTIDDRANQLRALGADTWTGTPQQFLDYIRQETDLYEKIIREAGIRIE